MTGTATFVTPSHDNTSKAHNTKLIVQQLRRQRCSLVLGLAGTILLALVGWGLIMVSDTSSLAAVSNLRSRYPELAATFSEGGGTNIGGQSDAKRFAYFFYVTDNNYACAALLSIDRLANKLQMNSTRIDVVVMHTPRIGKHFLHKMQEQQHVRTIQVESIKSDAADRTWQESLTKLRAFQDWEYQRVVFLDADAVPMANLDHLFDLPPAPLYAPTAYWLKQPFFASTLLVIEPSDEVFSDIMQWAVAHGAAAGFDMDILNAYFAGTVRHLSGVYTVLNSDFRRVRSAKSSLFSTTAELKQHTLVVHFSCKPDGSYGKPWNWPSHDLSLLEGEVFEPLFGELFEDYWRGERELCSIQGS